ncbi:MAG TPA: biopolymer transporter ExbD [bacterium]
MKFTTNENSGGVQIDITPIVDVVFNLMIFFALSMNFMLTPGIKVDLPESSAQEIVQKEKEIIVSVTPEGGIMVDSKSASLASLPDYFYNASLKNPDALLIIQADRNVVHGLVVEIMDIARNSGLKRIAIATRQRFDSGGKASPLLRDESGE